MSKDKRAEVDQGQESEVTSYKLQVTSEQCLVSFCCHPEPGVRDLKCQVPGLPPSYRHASGQFYDLRFQLATYD